MNLTPDQLLDMGYVEIPTGSGNWEKPKFLPPVEGEPETVHAPVEKERDLHDAIENYCVSKGWLYRHDRMDKPTTGQVGFPDFVIFTPMAITFFIECKARGKKATTAQLATLAHAKKLGYTAEITDSFERFLEIVK